MNRFPLSTKQFSGRLHDVHGVLLGGLLWSQDSKPRRSQAVSWRVACKSDTPASIYLYIDIYIYKYICMQKEHMHSGSIIFLFWGWD